jgi:general L-amino acid transport system permease protein
MEPSQKSPVFSVLSAQSIRAGGRWLRKHLLSTWQDAILSVLCLWLVTESVTRLGRWAFIQARWAGVAQNLRPILVGRYPVDQLWRLWLVLALLVAVTTFSAAMLHPWQRRDVQKVAGVGAGAILVMTIAHIDGQSLGLLGTIAVLAGVCSRIGLWCRQWPQGKQWLPATWFVSVLVTLWLIGGGLGLVPVGTAAWNGLLLSLVAAVGGIVLGSPLGILLALGRRSSLPLLRGLSMLYIRAMQAIPLIGILFIAQTLLPLLLPPQIEMDSLTKAIIGLTFFSAAYLAETVQSGLQSLPIAQVEAAKSLGLSMPQRLGLIILPQALRAVMPAMVRQFVELFKDTSLLSLVGLVELTGMARILTAQPKYSGFAEVYLVIGLLYWVFCYSMSRASHRLEHSLAHRLGPQL